MLSLPGSDVKIPPAGSQVWVEFEQGDPDLPIVCGYTPSGKDGSQAAPGNALAEDDNTTEMCGGKGGDAVDVEDVEGTNTILEPTTSSQPEYGYVQSLRVNSTMFEVDGTPQKERLQAYHDTGAYWEFGPGGQYNFKAFGVSTWWLKGSKVEMVSGGLKAVVGAPAEYYYNASVTTKIGTAYILTVGGDITETVNGSLIQTYEGGWTQDVGGLANLSYGALSIMSGGPCNLGVMGAYQIAVTGAMNVTVANADFQNGQVSAYALTAIVGNIALTATAGAFLITSGTALTLMAGAAATLTASAAVTVTAGAAMTLTASAAFTITAASVVQTAPTNTIVGKVFLGVAGAANPAVLGIEFVALMTALFTWLDTHTHTGNLGAPTTVPIVPSTSVASLVTATQSKTVTLV
jgi:hypothetical protein